MNKSYILKNTRVQYEYKFHNSYYPKWNLELLDEAIIINGKKINVGIIKSLIYEVDGTTYSKNPYGPSLCISNAYIEIKNKKEPFHLFTVTVEEKYILAKDSESSKVTSEILKVISEKYNIPYSYTLGVDTKRKTLGLIAVTIMIPALWIIIYLIKK